MFYTDSLIGYATATLVESGLYTDSFIGYVSAHLRHPHHPIGIKTSSGFAYVVIVTWDGTTWR